MAEHKTIPLKINGEQAVKLEKGTTEFKNYCKQIPVQVTATGLEPTTT